MGRIAVETLSPSGRLAVQIPVRSAKGRPLLAAIHGLIITEIH
jgi:hypothetical protein